MLVRPETLGGTWYAACVAWIMAAALFLLPAHVVAAERCDSRTEVCFSEIVRTGDLDLPLVGLGLFRYWGFKVYQLALHSLDGVSSPDRVLSPVPKRLTLHYFRDFSAQDFITSGRTMIQRNPTVNVTKIEDQLLQMDRLYRAIRPGDRYEVTFLPNDGVSLKYNGELLGVVTGSEPVMNEFQRAYFGIWLSEHGISRELRNRVLNIR